MVLLRVVGFLIRLLLLSLAPGKPDEYQLDKGCSFTAGPYTLSSSQCGSSLVFTVKSADSGGGFSYVPSLHDAMVDDLFRCGVLIYFIHSPFYLPTFYICDNIEFL